jgi:hypothetical protein
MVDSMYYTLKNTEHGSKLSQLIGALMYGTGCVPQPEF